jgi:hypothetical protein
MLFLGYSSLKSKDVGHYAAATGFRRGVFGGMRGGSGGGERRERRILCGEREEGGVGEMIRRLWSLWKREHGC